MKCVQDKADLQTWRVSDKEAARRVASGRYKYANKRVWKLQGRRSV